MAQYKLLMDKFNLYDLGKSVGTVVMAFAVAAIGWIFGRKKDHADTIKSTAEAGKINTEERIMIQRELAAIRIEAEVLRSENQKLTLLCSQMQDKNDKLLRRITILETFRAKN